MDSLEHRFGALEAQERGRGAHSSETSRVQRMKRPSAIFMMLALCTAVTFLRPFSLAYANANSATRLLATRVMTCPQHPTVSACVTTSQNSPKSAPRRNARPACQLGRGNACDAHCAPQRPTREQVTLWV